MLIYMVDEISTRNHYYFLMYLRPVLTMDLDVAMGFPGHIDRSNFQIRTDITE